MVEGCGQLNSSLSWGDGFAVDLDANETVDGESSAASFFRKLLDPAAPTPYRFNVILGPHVCAPLISTCSMQAVTPLCKNLSPAVEDG